MAGHERVQHQLRARRGRRWRGSRRHDDHRRPSTLKLGREARHRWWRRRGNPLCSPRPTPTPGATTTWPTKPKTSSRRSSTRRRSPTSTRTSSTATSTRTTSKPTSTRTWPTTPTTLEVVEEDDEAEDVVAVPVREKAGEGEEDEDDEDVLDPDDVEADLDTILKDRIAAAEEEEEDEEDEPADVEDRSGDGGKILPRRPGEFVCQSCFLVKSPPQLADAKRMLCVDCV